MHRLAGLLLLLFSVGSASACNPDSAQKASRWEGQLDSLPSGMVVVRNDGRGVWPDSGGWTLHEELRIGSLDEEGPQSFARIASLAVDHEGRVWVLEGQAAELRVFDATGAHVRTVGRKGAGPGEFRQPLRVDLGPEGQLWVVDPLNARLSVFDSAGTYLEGLRTPGGFVLFPWKGGFDERGAYYSPIQLPPVNSRPVFGFGRFDRSFSPLDTVHLPTDPVTRASFATVSNNGQSSMTAGVPFQGGLRWQLSQSGTVWALITDQYRLIEFTTTGDTLHVSTKQHEPLAVSSEERAKAIADLKWFTSQGGQIDESRIPPTRPLTTDFFLDDAGFVWVATGRGASMDEQPFDVFNPTGQFLGSVVAPFRLLLSPQPIVRDGLLYGVVSDSLDVPYVVRARIRKP